MRGVFRVIRGNLGGISFLLIDGRKEKKTGKGEDKQTKTG